MSKKKLELKAVNQKVDATETPSKPVATFTISKLPNGSVQFNFGGPDSDVLGIIEFGKIMIQDRLRRGLAMEEAVRAAQAAAQASVL